MRRPTRAAREPGRGSHRARPRRTGASPAGVRVRVRVRVRRKVAHLLGLGLGLGLGLRSGLGLGLGLGIGLGFGLRCVTSEASAAGRASMQLCARAPSPALTCTAIRWRSSGWLSRMSTPPARPTTKTRSGGRQARKCLQLPHQARLAPPSHASTMAWITSGGSVESTVASEGTAAVCGLLLRRRGEDRWQGQRGLRPR